MTIKEKLELLMAEKNLKSRKDLSRATGVPYNTIDGLFKGRKSRLSTLSPIADFFHISLDSLVNDKVSIYPVRALAFGGQGESLPADAAREALLGSLETDEAITARKLAIREFLLHNHFSIAQLEQIYAFMAFLKEQNQR